MAPNHLVWAFALASALGTWQTAAESRPSLTRRLDGQYDNVEIQVDASKHDIEFFNFVTRPDIDAPKWEIKVYNESAVAPGLWFVAPYGIVDQTHNDQAYVAPHIYDSDGDLVWSGATTFNRYNTFAFKVSKVAGKDMLTCIHPHESQGVILDDNYENYASVIIGQFGKNTNMHDFQIVDNGTKALYLNHEMTENMANSRQVGYDGGSCKINHNGIEEQDIETKEITFTWSSIGRIDATESMMYQHEPAELCHGHHATSDFLHLNAIEKLPDGDYLVSGRRSDTIYKVSRKDGTILWRLGGKKNDFDLDGHFSGQHDIRCLEQNSTHLLLTMMDNAKGPGWPKTTNPNSRGLVLSVNEEAMTAKSVMHYDHPKGGYASERGNFQTLPNGNALIFWTHDALTSEHTPDGEVIKVAKLRSGLKTYRGYKFEWVGLPKDPPDVHAEIDAFNGELSTVVHVSWNGATEVAFWNLYKTNADGANKHLIDATRRSGFETAILYPGYVEHVVVEGVDREGNKLGQSEVFHTRNVEGNNIADPALLKELEWLKEHPESTRKPTLPWSEPIIKNPLFTFFAGILLCVAIGLLVLVTWTVWSKCVQRRKRKMYAALADSEEEREGETFYDKDSLEADDPAQEDND